MATFRKILLTLFALFLVYRSYDLVRQLYYSNPIDFEHGETVLIAFLITLFVTGVFAFSGWAFPTSRLMPESYWLPKNPDRLNVLFDRLGVNTFKSILVLIFWGHKNNKKKYYNGTRAGLEDFNFQTKQSEFGHLWAFVVITFVSFFLLWLGYYLLVLYITIMNVFGNLYPVILQRHHRIRILRLSKTVGH